MEKQLSFRHLLTSFFQNHYFDVYDMEGISKEFNEIYIEVLTENFLRALKVSQNASSIKVKLTKKISPCLTFEVKIVCNIQLQIAKVDLSRFIQTSYS